MKILFSDRYWSIIGTCAAIIALLFSAYTFYASSELTKRTLIAGLTLDAHEKVYEFLAQVNQNHNARLSIIESSDKTNETDLVHPEIRLALVRAEGAIARAQVIENEHIQVCLTAMYQLMSGLIETSIGNGKTFSVQDYVLEMDDFPDMVRRYISQTEMTAKQKKTQRETSISECGPMEFKLPDE